MESIKISKDFVLPSSIPGRGGASMTLINSTETDALLIIACGASRMEQFDDFYTVKIDKASLKLS